MANYTGKSRRRFAGYAPWIVLIAAGSLFAQTHAPAPPAANAHRQLLIVVDGLRPDYVTPDVMPNLYALGQRGIVFGNHHSVFPTVTRVNASSFSTGAYPERHGLLGNTVFFPQVDATKFLDTSDRAAMVRVNEATQGNLLTSQTLGCHLTPSDALEDFSRPDAAAELQEAKSFLLMNEAF